MLGTDFVIETEGPQIFSIGDPPCLERSHLATVSAEMWAIDYV